MTERIPLDRMTSDQLDQLYARLEAAMPDQQPTTASYFIQSRPAPGRPWEQSGLRFSWESKAKALEKLAARREMQPTWEHRLMERITTITERPASEH